MPAETFHVAIAVVGYRNLADILQLTTALERTSYADFEVVICENGGAEATRALQSRLPAALPGGQTITVIEAPSNLGYAGGINVCIRQTPDADAWWVLNPDTQPAPGALGAMVERLASGACDAVGGPLCGAEGEVQSCGLAWRSWMARAVALEHGTRLADLDETTLERRISFLSGASMLVGRRFVQEAGLMREDYFLYAEEVEWCLRALQKGLRLGFSSEGVVVHHAGATTGSAAAIERTRPAADLPRRA